MSMSGFAGHIENWLAVARHEKIDELYKLNGYNFVSVTQSCERGIGEIAYTKRVSAPLQITQMGMEPGLLRS